MTRRSAILLPALLLIPALRALGDDPLPKGETVLDQYVEATGGKAAYEKLKNRVSRGTFEVEGAGLKGKIVVNQAAPNKMATEIDFAGFGKVAEGTDGRVFWELSPVTGDRVAEGEEKAEKLRECTFNGEVRWRDLYEKAECTGVEDVAGKAAYKVVLTPKGGGKPTTEFYDKASHLQVKSSTTSKSPMGEIQVETFVSDYKKADGILFPGKLTQKVLTQTIVITFDEVKHNVDLPADTFKVPDAVKELLDRKKDAPKDEKKTEAR
jgi:hypothetical protein